MLHTKFNESLQANSKSFQCNTKFDLLDNCLYVPREASCIWLDVNAKVDNVFIVFLMWSWRVIVIETSGTLVRWYLMKCPVFMFWYLLLSCPDYWVAFTLQIINVSVTSNHNDQFHENFVACDLIFIYFISTLDDSLILILDDSNSCGGCLIFNIFKLSNCASF